MHNEEPLRRSRSGFFIDLDDSTGQNGRCDGDEIPNIFFDVFSIAVAGVEMPMIVIIRKRVEPAACRKDKAVGIYIRQYHAGTAFQGHPAGNLQGTGFQQYPGMKAVSTEQTVLNDSGGMGGIQRDKTLPLHILQGDGGSGGNAADDPAVRACQNADGFFFNQLIGNVYFAGLCGGQGKVNLSLLQQALQVCGCGFRQFQRYVGIFL